MTFKYCEYTLSKPFGSSQTTYAHGRLLADQLKLMELNWNVSFHAECAVLQFETSQVIYLTLKISILAETLQSPKCLQYIICPEYNPKPFNKIRWNYYPTQEKRQSMNTGDSKMIQILELADKEFKVAISTIWKCIRVVIVKEKRK